MNFRFGRGEVTVRHVNRDALLAFGAQAVGEVRQIDLAAAGDVGGSFQRFDLIFHQRLRVVEQSADERGLAVVHRAAGVEAQNFMGCCVWGMNHSEISGFLAVLHRGFAGLVVGAGAAFGDARGGNFADDVVHAVGGRFNHAGADHVGDGAHADDQFS